MRPKARVLHSRARRRSPDLAATADRRTGGDPSAQPDGCLAVGHGLNKQTCSFAGTTVRRHVLPAVLLALCLLPRTAADAQDHAGLYSDHSNLSVVSDAGGPRPIRTAADWRLRREHILAGMQVVMGPLPSRENLPRFDIRESERLEGEGFIRTTITFAVEPGDRLPADLYLPSDLQDGEKRPAMLALHPTGAPGKRIVAGEGPRANRQYGLELAQRGYIVLCPDYPSFGDYADYSFESDAYASGTMKGISNHMRCVDLLQSLANVDADRIGVIGHSLGGHNALFVGAFDERLSGDCLELRLDSLSRLLRRQHRQLVKGQVHAASA